MVEAEVNPYGVDIQSVLEDEIMNLMKEIENHKMMTKVKTKGENIHKKMLAAKEKILERLIAEHPDGDEFLYDMQ